MNKIKIAILGSGFGKEVIRPAIELIDDFEIVNGYSCSNIDLLINDKNVNAVVLALPPLIQGKIVPRLKNKHLFLEKPLAANLKDGFKIYNTFKKSDKKVMIDFSFRFVDVFQKFKILLNNKKIDFIEINWLLNIHHNANFSKNWKDDIKMGGGVLNLYGSHILDYILWLFGDIKDIKLQKSNNLYQLLLKLKNGIPVTVNLSKSLPVGLGHSIKVWCDNGMFELENKNNNNLFNGFNISYYSKSGVNIIRNDFIQESRIDIARKALFLFSRIIQGENLKYPNLDDGIKVQKLLEYINGF